MKTLVGGAEEEPEPYRVSGHSINYVFGGHITPPPIDIIIYPETAPAQNQIIEILDELKELLLEKNRKYGNSALEPVRVFSHCDPVEQIKVRIDDKLSRIVSGQKDDDEEVIDDLLGYLVLLKICLRSQERLEINPE